MKKSTSKLALRRETVRALDNIDLTRARGGDDLAANASGNDPTDSGINCAAPAVK